MLAILMVAVALAAGFNQADAQLKVGYVSNWSQYRPGDGLFKMSDIDASKFTHINFAFAVIDAGCNIIAYEWNDDGFGGNYETLNNLKQQYPNLKTLIAIGGWNFGMDLFAQCLATAQTRQAFINSAVPFCRTRNFDGLDLDLEYPANRGSPPQDKANFALLVQGLRMAFAQDAQTSGRASLLLTAAFGVGSDVIDSAYDIQTLSNNLDFFNLMTYDFHGAWEDFTGLNSPLYSRPGETGAQALLNIDWAVNRYVQLGAPKNKLVVGLGTYGRCFTLTNAAQNGLGAPTIGPCTAGAYTREAGFLSYYEICDFNNMPGTTTVYSADHQGVYSYHGNQWVGYDNVQSLVAKAQYIKNNGYAGFMVWNVDLDDFTAGHCGAGRYPLITAINNQFTTVQTNKH